MRLQNAVNLAVFEDGFVCLFHNYRNEGVVSAQQLKIPFGRVKQTILD